jgi:salicylate hydroxylase
MTNTGPVADGVHSRLRKRITGDETHRAKKNGNTCYRIAISSAEVNDALGYLPEWWDPETADNRINVLQASMARIVWLPHTPCDITST